MNPGIDNTPGLGFQQPSHGMGQAPVQGAPGFMPPSAMAQPAPQPYYQTMPAAAQPAVPIANTPTVNPAAAHFPPEPQVSSFNEAADDDALDEEWVTKAKEVVARTQSDPYLQSKEISRIKAQYVKLRYNKDMKVSEDS